ncbi:MAG: hypothetical protein ACREBF_03670 [Candidatus Micrarchaeales archaeon]
MKLTDPKALDKEPDAQFRCIYCSHYVPSYNPQAGICPFCEIPTDKTNEQLKLNKPLFLALNQISDALLANKYDDATKAFEALIAIEISPQVLYAKGMLHLFLSDYEYSKRDYATPDGFMEGNAELINSGLGHFSDAKALFYKAISLVDKQPEADPTLKYVKFLAQIRLKRMLEAKKTLSEITAAGTLIEAYANMLYHCEVNDRNAQSYIEKVAELGIPNAFYYYSNLLVEDRKLAQAKKVLVKLLNKVDIQPAKKLLIGIERVQTII